MCIRDRCNSLISELRRLGSIPQIRRPPMEVYTLFVWIRIENFHPQKKLELFYVQGFQKVDSESWSFHGKSKSKIKMRTPNPISSHTIHVYRFFIAVLSCRTLGGSLSLEIKDLHIAPGRFQQVQCISLVELYQDPSMNRFLVIQVSLGFQTCTDWAQRSLGVVPENANSQSSARSDSCPNCIWIQRMERCIVSELMGWSWLWCRMAVLRPRGIHWGHSPALGCVWLTSGCPEYTFLWFSSLILDRLLLDIAIWSISRVWDHSWIV